TPEWYVAIMYFGPQNPKDKVYRNVGSGVTGAPEPGRSVSGRGGTSQWRSARTGGINPRATLTTRGWGTRTVFVLSQERATGHEELGFGGGEAWARSESPLGSGRVWGAFFCGGGLGWLTCWLTGAWGFGASVVR